MRFTEFLCKSQKSFMIEETTFCPDLNFAGFPLVAGTKHKTCNSNLKNISSRTAMNTLNTVY